MERWLHQHIFKVGWLLTQNYQTTTILYYTFFLPGIFIHELVYWLVAGVLNVRAEQAIQWPEKQEIGELHLKFVRISNRVSPIRKAIITAAPLITGILIIWYVATNHFNINAVFNQLSSGRIDDVAKGIQLLTNTPDFWLWFYFIFTISNTMFPSTIKDLRGWWIIIGAMSVIIIVLFIIGVGNQLFNVITPSLLDILSSLSAILFVIVGMNFFMTLILGLLEAIIERWTGHSATFKGGKMLTMTRAEMLTFRQQEKQRPQQSKKQSQPEYGIPSIYKLTLPIPAGPGAEPVLEKPTAILGVGDAKKPAASATLTAGNIIAETNKDTIERAEPHIRMPFAESKTDSESQPQPISPFKPSKDEVANPSVPPPPLDAPTQKTNPTTNPFSQPPSPEKETSATPLSDDNMPIHSKDTDEGQSKPSVFTNHPTGILSRPAPSLTSKPAAAKPPSPPISGDRNTLNKSISKTGGADDNEKDDEKPSRPVITARPITPSQGSSLSATRANMPLTKPTNNENTEKTDEPTPKGPIRPPLSPISRNPRDLRASLSDEEENDYDLAEDI